MILRHVVVIGAMLPIPSAIAWGQATGLPVLPRATFGTSFEVLAGVTTGGLVPDTSVSFGLTAMLERGNWAFTGVVSETPASNGRESILSYGALINWRSMQVGFGYAEAGGVTDVRIPVSLRFLIIGCLNDGNAWHLSVSPRGEFFSIDGDARVGSGAGAQFFFEWASGWGFRLLADAFDVPMEENPRLAMSVSLIRATTSWVDYRRELGTSASDGCVTLLGGMHD